MTIILGVDPGLEGALSFWESDKRELIACYDMPAFGIDKKRKVDGAGIAALVRSYTPDVAVVELVGAMKGWGVGSTFRFGEAAGTIVGALAACGVPVERIVPQVWKKSFGIGREKEEARQKVIQLLPGDCSQFSRKKDHQRADATLLAIYFGNRKAAP
jgi:Holliday junction resolvasome RuvABC endonuclease subunit